MKKKKKNITPRKFRRGNDCILVSEDKRGATLALEYEIDGRKIDIMQSEAAALIPILQRFVETGSIDEKVK